MYFLEVRWTFFVSKSLILHLLRMLNFFIYYIDDLHVGTYKYILYNVFRGEMTGQRHTKVYLK